MKARTPTKRLTYLLLGALLLATLACSLTGNGSEADESDQLELELAATQLAIELTQQALADQQQAPPQEQPAEPTQPPPAEEQAPSETAPNVEFEGISLYRDPNLAGWVDTVVYPESDSGEDAPYWDKLPMHYVFTFGSYYPTEAFHEPKVYVYPLADYIALVPDVAEIAFNLQQMLAAQPGDPEEIPFLPLFNAGQFFQAQVKYLDFQSGSGVRFLTMYGQAIWPVNNYSMFYSFQGLTSDQKYYVAAIFPVNHTSLPETGDDVVEDWPSFEEGFADYIRETEMQLSAYPENSFSPDLTRLDGLIQSIQIDK